MCSDTVGNLASNPVGGPGANLLQKQRTGAPCQNQHWCTAAVTLGGISVWLATVTAEQLLQLNSSVWISGTCQQ